jgi:uncharacterized protein (DUF952 family)
MLYQSSSEAREAGITYHLVPNEYWESNGQGEIYSPEAFAADGFIHCTNGIERLLWVGNEFYTGDPRSFRVLVLDVKSIESPVRYDDPNHDFPHIYGPLNTSAVVGTLTVERNDTGAFISIHG